MEKVKAGPYLEYIDEYLEIRESDEILRYTNVWGEQVLNVKGELIIVNPNPNKPGDKLGLGGHVAFEGFYNIDEKGNEVFANDNFDEYLRIEGKVRLLKRVKQEFAGRGIDLTIGPNNSVVIDDVKIIPDCYWHLPKKADELELRSKEIIERVNDFLTANITDENVDIVEQSVVQSICELDVSYLSNLDEGFMYSYSFKDELIIEFSRFFKKILLKGITKLKVKPSKCKYCFPGLKAFSFYSLEGQEFVERYVIGKHPNENKFVVEQCKNKSSNK